MWNVFRFFVYLTQYELKLFILKMVGIPADQKEFGLQTFAGGFS